MRDIVSRTTRRETHAPFKNFAQITRSFSRCRSPWRKGSTFSYFCISLTGSFPKVRQSRMIFKNCGLFFTGCMQKSSLHLHPFFSRKHLPSVKGWLSPTSFFMSENFSKSSCCDVWKTLHLLGLIFLLRRRLLCPLLFLHFSVSCISRYWQALTDLYQKNPLSAQKWKCNEFQRWDSGHFQHQRWQWCGKRSQLGIWKTIWIVQNFKESHSECADGTAKSKWNQIDCWLRANWPSSVVFILTFLMTSSQSVVLDLTSSQHPGSLSSFISWSSIWLSVMGRKLSFSLVSIMLWTAVRISWTLPTKTTRNLDISVSMWRPLLLGGTWTSIFSGLILSLKCFWSQPEQVEKVFL